MSNAPAGRSPARDDAAQADIARALDALALRQPRAPALLAPGRATLLFGHLGEQMRVVRARLAAWSIGPGDIVAAVIPSRPEMALACATLPAAATLAPLSGALTFDAYKALLARTQPKAVVLPRGVEHPLRHAARACAITEIDLIADRGAPAGMFDLALARADRSLDGAAAAHPEWAYLLATSGTTGRGKLVPRSHRSSMALTQHLGDWLQIAPRDIGCHVVPMHHSHGLTAALMVPLLRGASVVCLEEGDIDAYLHALGEQRVSWFTAPVTHQREILRRAAQRPAAAAANALRFVRVSAGRLAPEEMERIEQAFATPVLMGYGMTEATPITHQALPPRARKRGSAGLPVCERVAILGDAGIDAAAGTAGEIVVRSPLVFDGYYDDPRADAEAFVDGWFRTGDLGRFDDDGHLYVLGRIKDIINRGGEKIWPAEVDEAIEALPGIRAAATFGVPHRSLGEEVAAAVVRESAAALDAAGILAAVRDRLGPKRAPRRIYLVDELPRTDVGKLRRAELPRLLGLDRSGSEAECSPSAPARPASALEAALSGVWCAVLELRALRIDDDFFLAGGDSLRGTQLLARVEALFGVELPLDSLFGEAATIAGMARRIEASR